MEVEQEDKNIEEKDKNVEKKDRNVEEKDDKTLDESSLAAVRIGGAPFVYQPPNIPINGPPLPKPEDLARMGYLQHVRHSGGKNCPGGCTAETYCMRALFESRNDLFFSL